VQWGGGGRVSRGEVQDLEAATAMPLPLRLPGGEKTLLPGSLTPKRFLSPIGDFATSRRDARQLLVGQE